MIHEVCGGVVGFSATTAIDINAGHKFGRDVGGKLVREVDGQVVFALGVEDLDRFLLVDEHTGVTHLAAHFSIEGRGVEHELEVGLFLLRDLAILEDAAAVFGVVPTHKLGFAFVHGHPVGGFDGGGIAGTLFLLFHLGVEGSFVDGETGFGADEFGEVEGGNRRYRKA